MATLPEEMITEILSWMSGKALTRFKCVSKPWCKLISSPGFIKLQSERSNQPLLVFVTDLFGPDFKSMELDALDRRPSTAHQLLTPKDNIDIVGSSNGFLCIRLCVKPNFKFVLYNLITRVEKPIPPCIPPPNLVFMFNGFGYDPTIDDYKLVSIFNCYNGLAGNNGLCISAWVYSLKADKWVRSILSPKTPCYVDPGANYGYHHFNSFVNNAFHWIGYRTRTYSSSFNSHNVAIACFSFSNEQIYEIPLPNFGFNYPVTHRYQLRLGVLGRRLHILVENVDLWVMNEYGVKKSWTKLYTLPRMEGIVRPIAYWRTESEILFQKRTKQINEKNTYTVLFSLDLKNRTVRDLGIHLNTKSMVGYYEKKTQATT